MEVLNLGHNLLILSGFLACSILLLALAGMLRRNRRLLDGARSGFYVLLILLGGAAGSLVYAFWAGIYNSETIYNHSEKFLPTFFKLAGLWAGLDGSLLFWAFLLAAFSALVALQHRWSNRHESGRRLEPWVYLVLAALNLFFILVTWSENPFKTMPLDLRLRLADLHGVGLDSSGNLLDGGGLNQQLVNYWFVIHPPTLYLGFVGWSVPFAFGIAGLMTGDLGTYWIRIVRRWSLVSWIFLTSGIVLGGLWAYRQLGWGGYWAWDPVENASLLPWLTGTAFTHSLLVMERRDLLKRWSLFLLLLTFYLTIVGTWMTRSGVVTSVHAFAGGPVGTWFLVFLFVLAAFSVFALAYRFRTLAGRDRIESLFSRESVFFFNNFVLVAIAVVVFGLSFLPKISHDWFAAMRTDQDGGTYNRILTPLFVLLLFLTAVGPGLGWVRTTPTTLRRNFRFPLLATGCFLVLLYTLFIGRGLAGSASEILVPKLSGQHSTALYPTGVILGCSFFVVATVLSDFFRGVSARVRNRGENPIVALGTCAVRNNRRYGGYTVHVGLAVLAAGIVISSMFRVKEELVLHIGEKARVGPYVITPVSETVNEEPLPGEPYAKVEVEFRVYRAADGYLPVAHGETGSAGDSAVGPPGELVASLRPERRFYPKKSQWISEVTIHRKPLEDIYLYFSGRDRAGRISFEIFLNPFMMLIWLGWITMVAGAVLAALPLQRNLQRNRRASW